MGQFFAGPSELAAIGVGDALGDVGEAALVLLPLAIEDPAAADELDRLSSLPPEGEQALKARASAAATAK